VPAGGILGIRLFPSLTEGTGVVNYYRPGPKIVQMATVGAKQHHHAVYDARDNQYAQELQIGTAFGLLPGDRPSTAMIDHPRPNDQMPNSTAAFREQPRLYPDDLHYGQEPTPGNGAVDQMRD